MEPSGEAAFEALLSGRGGDLILLVDESVHILRAGPAAAELADRSESTLAGMSLIAAFGSAELDAVARDAIAARRVISGEADLGLHVTKRFAVDAIPLPGGVVLSLHDITALRHMERVRRDFVANVGHELRTPLSSIKLLAETLSSGAVDDGATMRDFGAQVAREVDHLAQLVDELLDLSRIESGETRLSLEALDPAEVVSTVLDRIGAVAARRDVTLRLLVSPSDAGSILAFADRGRLGQALLNLAHNAVKFSHPGGEVRVGWEPAGRHVRFLVSDDGIGVPDAHKDRIFERLYKVDRARIRGRAEDDQEGGGSAGLGLSIVRHIAEAHGGSAGMESEEGVGSTFWIEVPKATDGGPE